MAFRFFSFCFVLLIVLLYTNIGYACKNSKHLPSVPFVQKRVWKYYTNKTLEMEIFRKIEKERILPVNVTLEIDSEMKLSKHNVSEAPIKFSFQLLQKMPLFHLSSPQFSGSVLRKTGKHFQKILMYMDFEIDEHLKLLHYCTRLSSNPTCIVTHTMTYGGLKQQHKKNLLSFFIVLNFRQQNILLCIANDKNKKALHCYNHLSGLDSVNDFYLNGDILLKVNRTEACMKRMKFNSVSYINHQLVLQKQKLDALSSNISSSFEPFSVQKSQQIDYAFKSINEHFFLKYYACKDDGSHFCEFTKPSCINKKMQCKNRQNNLYTWNTFNISTTIKLDRFDVHRIKNISIGFATTKGLIAFTSMSGKILDRIAINPILNSHNILTDRFLVSYRNQTSQLLFSSSRSGYNSRKLFWIYIEFPENINEMCMLQENAKVFVCTENQLSFLGHASNNPRYWYSVKLEGAKQMRISLQNHVELTTPILFPVYSSIPVYSSTADQSSLDISNISLDNCRRIPWAPVEDKSKIVLSNAVPIAVICIFLFLCLMFVYKFWKQRYLSENTNFEINVLNWMPSRKESLKSYSKERDAGTTEESIYYRKRRNMKYTDEIEHSNVNSFILMEECKNSVT